MRAVPTPVRAARATAGAATSVLVAVGVHRMAGGVADPAVVLGLIALATAVAWRLTARRVATRQVIGLMVLCQAVVHTVGHSDAMAMGAAMMAAHVVGTAVATALLVRGERWVWSLGRTVLRALRLAAPTPPALARVAPIHDVARRHHTEPWAHVLLRGPPARA